MIGWKLSCLVVYCLLQLKFSMTVLLRTVCHGCFIIDSLPWLFYAQSALKNSSLAFPFKESTLFHYPFIVMTLTLQPQQHS